MSKPQKNQDLGLHSNAFNQTDLKEFYANTDLSNFEKSTKRMAVFL